MKNIFKFYILLLIILLTFSFVGCTTENKNNNNNQNNNNNDKVEVVSNLTAPENVIVSKVDEKIRITFDLVEHASSYRVVISNNYEDVKRVNVDNNLFAFKSSELPSGEYKVKVRANGDNKIYYNSIYSNAVSFTIENGEIEVNEKLQTPTNIAISHNEKSLNVSFNKVTNALKYKVQIIDSKGSVVLEKELDSNSSVIDTSAIVNGDYSVIVYAIGDSINYIDSNPSDKISIKINNGTSTGGPNGEDKNPLENLSAYYKKAEGQTGNALKSTLRNIITSTHKKTTSYSSLKDYLQDADEDPNNSNNMLLFYTAESVKKTNNMNIWNREHVWAQSLTSGWFGTSGAGADMHHIRPCDPGVNSSRGNKKFGEGSSYYLPYNVGGSGTDYRGDVARIILYMFTRYTEADSRKFTDIFDSLDTILEWNKIDPVSETETIRNEYSYEIQGNRNPFIDYPAFADAIWG